MSRKDFFPVHGGEVFPADLPRQGAPETAQNMQGSGFRVITLTLDTALVNHQIKVKGNQFWVVDTTDLDVTANVQFNDLGGQGAPIAKGFALKGIPFNRIYVNADAQAGKTITFLTTFIPNAPIEFVNPTNSANEVKLLKGTRIEFRVEAPAAIAEIIAADASRLSYMIKNTHPTLPINLYHTANFLDALSDGWVLNPSDTIIVNEAPAAQLFALSFAGTGECRIIEEFRS